MSALRDVAGHLAAVDPRLLAVALILHLANHLLRSTAWRTVIAAAYPGERVPLIRIASAYAAGVALNAVAPARGGDAAKVLLVRAAVPGSGVTTIASTMSVLVAFDVVLATVLALVVGLSGAAPLAVPALPGWQVLAAALLAAGVLALVARRMRDRVGALVTAIRRGGAVLRDPRRYVLGVVAPQAAAWSCRVGVVFCLLAAFGLPASVPLAALVMIMTGASTLIPLTPGGVGTQQVVLAFALSQTASATAIVSFSLGMQASVTAVNALLGVLAAMAICRTARPLTALRMARNLA